MHFEAAFCDGILVETTFCISVHSTIAYYIIIRVSCYINMDKLETIVNEGDRNVSK